MRIMKTTSGVDQSLSAVEAEMDERGISVWQGCNGLMVGYRGKKFRIVDVDGDSGSLLLPRATDDERLEPVCKGEGNE